MKPKAYLPFSIVLMAIFTGFTSLSVQSASDKLSGSEIKPVAREIEGEVWPELTAKVLIKARPLESAAIFAAYDYQINYIPGLIKSKVIAEKVDKEVNDTRVAYTLEMPWPLSNSQYIHGHELTQPKKDVYKVRWYMIESDSADNVQGSATFAPHPQNPKYTLMTYVSLVSPKSFAAGIFKKIMVGDVIKSLKAIRETTEELKLKNSPLLKKYSTKITSVLAGQKAYSP